MCRDLLHETDFEGWYNDKDQVCHLIYHQIDF